MSVQTEVKTLKNTPDGELGASIGEIVRKSLIFFDSSWDMNDPRLWANQVEVGG